MKRFSHFNAVASAKRCAEAFRARSSSHKAVIVLDVILVASISVVLAVELVIEILELLAVCLLVRKATKEPLKAVRPAM